MFAQCMRGDHHECPGRMNGRYAAVCDCPCHTGRKPPENPCKRCHGTGYYGPWSVEGGVCFRCGGSGEEPTDKPN